MASKSVRLPPRFPRSPDAVPKRQIVPAPYQVGAWLRKVVLDYCRYHAVPGNSTQLRIFRRRVCWLWRSVPIHRMSGKATRPAAQSLPLHGLPGAPHPAGFADHMIIAGTNRRDFLQYL